MSILSKYWTAPATGSSPEDRAIRVEQLLTVTKMTPVFATACGFMSVLTVIILWDHAQPVFVLIWCAIVTGLPGMRLSSWWRHRNTPKPFDIRPEIITLIINRSIILGLFWGLGVALLYPAGALPQQIFLAMIVTGVGVGGAAGLTAIPRAAIGFSLALLLPFLVRIFIGETSVIHQGLLAMSSVFVLFVLFLSRSSYASFLDMVRAQVSNNELVGEIEGMRNNLLDAMDGMSEGFAIFDEGDRLRYFNDKYRDMYGPIKDLVRPGVRFAEIIEATPAPQICDGRTMGPEEWREWRLRRHQEGAGSFQQEHMNR